MEEYTNIQILLLSIVLKRLYIPNWFYLAAAISTDSNGKPSRANASSFIKQNQIVYIILRWTTLTDRFFCWPIRPLGIHDRSYVASSLTLSVDRYNWWDVNAALLISDPGNGYDESMNTNHRHIYHTYVGYKNIWQPNKDQQSTGSDIVWCNVFSMNRLLQTHDTNFCRCHKLSSITIPPKSGVWSI